MINGEENGNYCITIGLYRDHIGIMEKNMHGKYCIIIGPIYEQILGQWKRKWKLLYYYRVYIGII